MIQDLRHIGRDADDRPLNLAAERTLDRYEDHARWLCDAIGAEQDTDVEPLGEVPSVFVSVQLHLHDDSLWSAAEFQLQDMLDRLRKARTKLHARGKLV